MPTLSSPGIGSGLDVKTIVSQLVAIEQRPLVQLQAKKDKLTTQLSSFGLLQSYVGNLQSAAGQLGKTEFWGSVSATSSDSSAVSVTAPASTAAASYSIDVVNLATAQSLSTAAGAITGASNLGAGTLTVTRGGKSVAITVANGTNLTAVRDQINAAKAGINAAIIQDGAGPRLVLTGTDTGLANVVTDAVTGATGQLAALAYPGAMTQDRAAVDAVLKDDGLQTSSASNKLTNVVDGVTLTLSKATSSPVQVTIGTDTAAMRKGITDFVSAYNDINRFLAAQTKYDDATKTAGALQGDGSAVGLQAQLRGLLQQTSPASASFGRLSIWGWKPSATGRSRSTTPNSIWHWPTRPRWRLRSAPSAPGSASASRRWPTV